ncbi:probable disease resistance protein At4g27220 [Trifolium pratense]|uniref:probable disease resistance protein At4g27220 n=1 Tax=Trifolium pratense TaxID=57577 RepID=UPI001E691A2F|nr:probable disease resistance protein At4g27220 [Trifolium pratense]
MASFLCDLVKPYVEKLINGAIAEAHHVFCFTCIVKEFEEERVRLEPERITMVQRVKVAKERDKDIQADVGSWAEEIDKLNQVDTKTKQTCFFGFCPDCIWRYKKGKELANNLKDIKRLLEKGGTFVDIELPRPLPDVERYSTKEYISFKSREANQKELLDALKDDNNYITGLQGMGGTGKTTLAKEVGKELKQSEQFAYVVDTTVTFTPDIKKIQDEIAGPLGLKLDGFNEVDRPKKLWSRLTNGDKILVILDDVWDRGPPLDFDAIGIPKRDNHKGCRVLVTSRNKQTFNKMDCDKRIELGLLSEEDAWLMFEMYAGIRDSFPKKLIDKAREIAIECKRLPVAISVIASSLKGQQDQEVELDVTLNSLKQPVSMHGVDDDMAGIYKCLKFSYDYLKDEKAKGLFLLCSVFREDEEISISIGVGRLGEDYGYYNDARNQVVVARNRLVDSCLLLEDDKKRLKMHDLVRDAAHWIANKEIQCVKLFDKKQKSLVEKQTNIKYLLCEGKCLDLFFFNFDGSKLETLIFKVDRDYDSECIEVPNSFFENVINLRVLYFSGNYFQHLSLPDSIQSLTNIRSMLVDEVDLGDISILGNLQSLETLYLVKCTIKELPDQITKLRKFKLLKLKHCKIRTNNPFEVIKRCSSLEELYFKYSFNDFCQEITLPELQRYHIRNHWKAFYSDKTNLSKYVVFCGNEKCQFSEETLKYCMQTAEALSLERIKGEWRNLSRGSDMNDLVELHLRDMPQLQCLIDTVGSQVPIVLSKLVVLELKNMEILEELFIGPFCFQSLNNLENLSIMNCKHLRSLFKGKLNLCNLKTITLDDCPMLVSLFEVSTFRNLLLLETLEIFNCEGLETIIADERREDEEIDDGGNNKNHGSMFSKLKVISIEECHRLESILPFLFAQDLPALETIRITKCDGLKYVFGQSQHFELVSLSQLELSELPNFIDIFEECYDPMSSSVKGSSSTSKAQIQLDPIKCNTFSWWTRLCCQTRIPLVDDDGDQPHDNSVASESNSHRLNIWKRVQCLPIQSKIPCNIKEIVLTHFPKMKSVFILSIAQIMQLETLRIMNCDELKHVIVDTGDHETGGNNWVNVIPKLKELLVFNCPQLEYIFGHDTSDHQNHMEIRLHLPELRDLHLFGLPSLIAMCPKQYRITFPSLKSLKLRKCSKDNTIIKVSLFPYIFCCLIIC